MPSIKKIFAKDGLLTETLPGFVPRAAQTDMALAVEKAIKRKSTLVVEAGTGTGKTYAYLVPALLAENKKVIVSTGTKNLQEQLFHRDLPRMRDALGSHKRIALLKGRANYLCDYRLLKHSNGTQLMDKQQLADLAEVRRWATTTRSGDIGEIKTLAEDSPILPYVTSTVDNCLGRECAHYEDCYLVKARANALLADIVVVNHHLFFADLALKDTGFGELVPESDVIIFDEAHQVPDIASDYFGEAVSTRQLVDLSRDADAIARTTLKDAAQISAVADKLIAHSADLRLLLPENPQKGASSDLLRADDITAQLARVNDALAGFVRTLKIHLGREKELDTLYERALQYKDRLMRLSEPAQPGVTHWYETTPKQLVLHLTPLSIADKFADIVADPKRSWIFTSATLAVGKGFEHFTEQMGLADADTLALDSPFDYANQALLCVPRYLPEPHMPSMREKLVDISVSLVKASQGRCFLLFTSHATLRDVAEKLSERVTNKLLVQGSMSKRALLDAFVADKHAVLLGTGAFWEGVDVPGDDLTCVMIDKLPFASPDDPILKARVQDINQRGGKAFFDYQIPQAVIALKQGAGRLIRDAADKGVLVICDNRLVSKDYAQTFLASLPPMAKTRDLATVSDFLHTLNK